MSEEGRYIEIPCSEKAFDRITHKDVERKLQHKFPDFKSELLFRIARDVLEIPWHKRIDVYIVGRFSRDDMGERRESFEGVTATLKGREIGPMVISSGIPKDLSVYEKTSTPVVANYSVQTEHKNDYLKTLEILRKELKEKQLMDTDVVLLWNKDLELKDEDILDGVYFTG